MAQQWDYAEVRYSYGKGAHRSARFTCEPSWATIPDDYIGLLRRLGDDGWEVVNIHVSADAKIAVLTLKRPKAVGADG